MSHVLYGPAVRIRREASPNGGDDLVVEVRQVLGRISDPTSPGPRWPFPTYQWVEKKRSNEMSNGSAFTDCDRLARHFRQQVQERDYTVAHTYDAMGERTAPKTHDMEASRIAAGLPTAPLPDGQEGSQEPS